MRGPRPSWLEKVSFGFGNLGSCLYWQSLSLYLLYFYTDVFGLSIKAAGMLVLISRSFDAFLDPVMGMVADRTNTRWGKFRPFLLWFCAPLAVLGVLTFTVPNFGSSAKVAWACATYSAFMLLYTVINIPYVSLLGVISRDPNDRTTLCSIQFVGAFVGGLIASATLLPMAHAGGWLKAATNERGWQLAFVLYGVAAVICFLITFAGVRERVSAPKAERTPILRDLKDLFTNRPWLTVLAATITFGLSGSVRNSAATYYFKYFVRSHTLSWPSLRGHVMSWESLASVFNTSTQVASLAGVLALPAMASLLGRKRTLLFLYAVTVVASGAYWLLGRGQVETMLVLNVASSLAGGALTALLWAMYADTADYGEWRRGRRATGLVFSASIFSQKQGVAIGAWLTLAVMQQAGFVANRAQTEGSQRALVLLMSLVSAGFAVVSAACVLGYPLDEGRMREINSDLERRRGVVATPV